MARAHHQGNVGEVFYAAVPELVQIHQKRGVSDWNTYAIAATIEESRQNERYPAMPDWLLPDYEAAWRKLQALALAEFPDATDDELIHSIMAVLAFAKGRITLGRMAMLTEDERKEMLDATGRG